MYEGIQTPVCGMARFRKIRKYECYKSSLNFETVTSSLFWDVTQPTYTDSQSPAFRDNLSVPSSKVKKTKHFYFDCLTLEDGTDKLSRNVDNLLAIYAAQHPKREILFTLARPCSMLISYTTFDRTWSRRFGRTMPTYCNRMQSRG